MYDKIGLIEYITVPQNDDLVITNGPFIIPGEHDFNDKTNLTICDVGGAGNHMEVFNNYEGDLEFYYPESHQAFFHTINLMVNYMNYRFQQLLRLVR